MTATPYADQNGAWTGAEDASLSAQEALQNALSDLYIARDSLHYYHYGYTYLEELSHNISYEREYYVDSVNNIINNIYSNAPETVSPSLLDMTSESLQNFSERTDFIHNIYVYDRIYQLEDITLETHYKIDSSCRISIWKD